MPNTIAPIRWGIIGPGAIARDFRDGLKDSTTGKLGAIASRDPSKPGLAEQFAGARILDGYQAMLDDPDIDAIYIATPHPGHAEWAIKAAEAGKNVLIEKPMTLSAAEADAVFNAHAKAGTFAGEAFMYRLHPATAKLAELIRADAIGQVRMIQSSFGFQMPAFDPAHRIFSSELGGGGILDVGGYTVSMSRFIAGVAAGKPFLDPIKTSGMAHLGLERTDEWAAATLEFENGILAQVSCAIFVQLDNVLRVHGATGRIEVEHFWFAGGDRKGGPGRIDIVRPDGSRESSEIGRTSHLYSFEIDAVADALREGRQQFNSPGMSWDDTMGNMRALDKWRADAGLEYLIEKPARRLTTLKGAALKRGGTRIPRRTIPGINKSASVLATGFEDFWTFAKASVLLDAFFEAGGNLFDSAWVYAGGKPEAAFGEWQASRGVREEIVLISKGAHSPLCYPDVIGRQLEQSLERLKTDYVDVYLMHRDNTDVPAGEFVDAMDAEVKAGRIRGIFGGSNWSLARMDEAIAYAGRTGKTAPAALSNNFALAEMLRPLWPGVASVASKEGRAWLTERQIPNFSWSSQARGFFTERAGRDKRDNPEMVDTWYSEGNFSRRDRAIDLAKELNATPIQVALAYVMAQPFPSIPLIGPRRLGELDESLGAVDLNLTPEQVRWLEG
jgi:predicted dehydrogenase/aryl-alcohol dehydrogenase-like predicted oxidoreductase